MATGLINKTHFRKYTGETQVTEDSYDALEDRVKRVIDDALERAEENDRTTVMARDF